MSKHVVLRIPQYSMVALALCYTTHFVIQRKGSITYFFRITISRAHDIQTHAYAIVVPVRASFDNADTTLDSPLRRNTGQA